MAETHFAAGRFADAAAACAPAFQHGGTTACQAVTARVRMLEDRVSEAIPLITAWLKARPADREARQLLAEAHYRQGRGDLAAPHYQALDRGSVAKKLESLGASMYRIAEPGITVTLPFLQTDPLPMVDLIVNGERGSFILDTGGAELILDPGFAKRVGAVEFGPDTGTFAGGQRAAIQHGAVRTVGLGAQRLDNVPVLLLDTAKFALVAGGRPVAGVLGTLILYRFTATIDYPGARLVLAPRAVPDPGGGLSLPLWMAGDHFLITPGRFNDAPETMLFLDTGLAGPAFAVPESELANANIRKSTEGHEGVSGAGRITVHPLAPTRVALGPLATPGLTGLAGAFPPPLEHRFGFRIGGLVSHGLLRPYRVTLDFGRMRLGIQPPGSAVRDVN
ncbi:MAG: aspartyl protease family protein [Betaproteobacteria bacterium]|nr:aspartyl protease family protein [Betaproteobacteria bacterium]